MTCVDAVEQIWEPEIATNLADVFGAKGLRDFLWVAIVVLVHIGAMNAVL